MTLYFIAYFFWRISYTYSLTMLLKGSRQITPKQKSFGQTIPLPWPLTYALAWCFFGISKRERQQRFMPPLVFLSDDSHHPRMKPSFGSKLPIDRNLRLKIHDLLLDWDLHGLCIALGTRIVRYCQSNLEPKEWTRQNKGKWSNLHQFAFLNWSIVWFQARFFALKAMQHEQAFISKPL